MVVHMNIEQHQRSNYAEHKIGFSISQWHTCHYYIHCARRNDHITPILRDLHWLRVPERIAFLLVVLVYRCQLEIGPSYLAAELHRVVDVESRCRLRSASTTAPVVPHTTHPTISDRAFPVAAARVWNTLPSFVTSSPSLATFRHRLKTELFSRAFRS